MGKPRNKYLDYAVYLAYRFFEMWMRFFTARANYPTYRLFGDIAFYIDRRHRRRAVEHLRRSFPDWPERRILLVARKSMQSFSKLAMEIMFTPKLITRAAWRKRVRFRNLQENVRLMLENTSPVLYVTGHFGSWEIAVYTMSILGFPVHAVARALDNPYLDAYIRGIRQRSGLTILDKKGAIEQVDDILDGKGILGWVADQDAGRKGLFVDFFGRKASTFKSIGLLAIRYEAPIVVGYGLRLDEEFHFEVAVEKVIHPRDWTDKEKPLEWITQEYTKALEDVVRRYPDQYLWSHRRWKHRPKGEEEDADGIA